MRIKNLTTFFSNFLTFGKLRPYTNDLKTGTLNVKTLSLGTLFEHNFRKLQIEVNEKKNKLSENKTKQQ